MNSGTLILQTINCMYRNRSVLTDLPLFSRIESTECGYRESPMSVDPLSRVIEHEADV
jgi:hypothetical protein